MSATLDGVVATGRLTRGRIGLAAGAVVASAGGVVVELVDAPAPVGPLGAAVAVALAVLAGLCVLPARTVAAAAAVVALCLAYHLLGFPGLAPAVVLFVVLYTLSAQGGGSRSLVVAGAFVVAVSAVPLLPPHPVAFGWSVAGPAVGLAALAAMGEAARARRVAARQEVDAVRAAVEQDARRREAEVRLDLARELHDVLAHTVTVIAVQAAAAGEALDERPEEARAGMAAVRQAAREAMAELRAAIALLRTPPDTPADHPGLPELDALCERARGTGLAVTLTVAGERALPGVVERAAYRIVQEALTNTVRHAAAAHARVRVDIAEDEVRVEVCDDGRGAAAPTLAPGHGLLGMRERAQALGGTLEAGPVAGQGFRVAARLPVAT